MEDNQNTAIIEISKAEMALERASDIHEMIDLRSSAAAYNVLADARGFKEAAQKAKIFQLKAERKAGKWLEENVRHEGGDPNTLSHDVTALPEGVDRWESSRWQLESKVPEETFLEWVDECLSTGKEISAAGLQRLGKLEMYNTKPDAPPLPDEKYSVILADPPWQYGNAQHSKEEQDTVLESHYSTMSIEEICALPIDNIASDDAVLFLWATSPLLPQALRVIQSWGFEYKSSFIWDKIKHNVGYYNSVRHEFLLIAVKGSHLPEKREGEPILFDSVQSIERTRHSEKPEKFREIIEYLYPSGKYIELFARKASVNWTAWGNENV